MAAPKTMKLAEKARNDPTITPYSLWDEANAETGSEPERVSLFRHAMIHAGMLVPTETEKPYAVCPICAKAL